MKNYICKEIYLENKTIINEVLLEYKIKHNEEYFKINTQREKDPLLAETNSYSLRYPNVLLEKSNTFEQNRKLTQNCLDYKDNSLSLNFPKIKQLAECINTQVFKNNASIGRIIVSKLKANKQIPKHFDEGFYFDNYHRFHLPLKSDNTLFCWDEFCKPLQNGQLYLINNSITHWVDNSNKNDRTALIIDMAIL